LQRAAYGEAAPAPKTLASAEVPPGWTKGPDAAAPTPPAKPKAGADAARPPGKTPSETTVAARSTDDSNDDDAQAAGKGWKIQIGATEDAAKATALLDRARLRDRTLLAAAKPMTEKVRKGDGTLYRAQFAGLDSASAESACRSLKRSGFSCFATRD
jgi:D-alanyl-D-alanine carboxypeptidase